MAEIQAIHECLFCPQTFDTATAKDDHVLEHFAQETCTDCNRDLIRIGGNLYVKHDASICSVKAPKTEKKVESTFTISLAAAKDDDSQCTSIMKTEQPNLSEDSNESIDFDVLDKLDNLSTASTDSEGDNQSITSDVEFKLQEMFCREETEQTVKYDNESIDAENNRQHKFTCNQCRVTFLEESLLEKHQCTEKSKRQIHSENPIGYSCTTEKWNRSNQVRLFVCRACGYSSKYKQTLLRHHIGKHAKDNTINGDDIFDVRVENIQDPVLNIIQTIGEDLSSRFTCMQCHTTFLEESCLHEHQCTDKLTKQINAKSPRGRGRIQCKLCPTKFQTNGNLYRHMRLQHNSYMYNCGVCQKVFKIKKFLLKHLRVSHYLDTDVRIPCKLCGEILEKSAHKHHRLMFHSPDETLFCRTCLKIFPNDDDLNAHRAQCNKKVSTIHECDICKKQYANKGDIRRHMRTKHDPNVDKFKCKSCRTIFIQEISLQNHKCKGKKINPSLRELIPCESCGKFISRGAIRSHRIALHSAPGTVFCRSCHKIFSNADDLKAHTKQCKTKMLYEKESPCDVCGKILSSSRALIRHKISLHSDGVIFCKTCVKKFNTVEELSAHKSECTLKRKLYKQNQLTGND